VNTNHARMTDIAVVDYGMGNCVRGGSLGACRPRQVVTVTSEPAVLRIASRWCSRPGRDAGLHA